MRKPDEAHRLTDLELDKLERRIAAEYKKAADELIDTINTYFERFEERDAETKALIGTIVNGKEYTEQDYKQWRLAQIGRGKRFIALRDRVAERMTRANEVAAAYVIDTTPGIYSLNRNYAAYTIEQVAGDVGFDLWDEQTVKRLLVEEPDLMPYYPPKRAVKRGIDLAWGKKQITNVVTSSVLQGKSIKGMADDLQTRIPEMNRDSAIRAARTAVTGAQNAGRMDSYKAAQDMGIKLKRQWLATLDNRTRHAHAALDGQQAEMDKPFHSELGDIMYPGDPWAAPANIYNCRCTLIAAVEGVDTSEALRRDRYGVLPDMTYAQWEASKRGAEGVQVSPYRNKEVKEWHESLRNKENLAILKSKIDSGEISTKVSAQQQQKHIEGTSQFARYLADRIAKGKHPQSILTVSIEKAQALIDRYSCTGIVDVTRSGKIRTVEFVTTDLIVGKYFENDSFLETSRVAIHYGKKGAHIVPVKEKQK